MTTNPQNIDQNDQTPDKEENSGPSNEGAESPEGIVAPIVGEPETSPERAQITGEDLVDSALAPTLILSDNQNTKPEIDDTSANESCVEDKAEKSEATSRQDNLTDEPPALPSSDVAESTTQGDTATLEDEAIKSLPGNGNKTLEPKGDEVPPPMLPVNTELVLDPPSVELKPGESHTFKLSVIAASGDDLIMSADMVANVKWAHGGNDTNYPITSNCVTSNYQAGRLSGDYTVTATLYGKTAEAKVKIILPKPVWKEEDPKDRTDWVDHEIHDTKDFGSQWKVMAASVRGRLHAHKASYREDSYAFAKEGEWNIIVMADGAGSASLSRIGSRIACDSSVKTMGELLKDFQLGAGAESQPSDSDLKKLKAFLVQAATDAYNSVVGEAHKRGCELRDLSSTFLLTIHVPWNEKHLLAAIQVGDGAIGVYKKDGSCTVLGVADHGEFSSETVFLTSKAANPLDQRVRFTIQPDVQCIGVMSDGVSDDFFPEQTNLVNLFNASPIADMKSASGEEVRGMLYEIAKKPKDAAFLAEWLKYVKKGSSDDRTLVLLINKDLTID